MPNGETEIPTTAPSSPPSSATPRWIELPEHVMANILKRLSIIDILETVESVQIVCTTWRRFCKNPSIWQVLNIKNPTEIQRPSTWPYYFNLTCRHAVDRSQGQLIDFSIEYFGTDELLQYISQRSRHLQCLKLACCIDISSKVLKETVKNLPELEELHLIIMPSIQAADIENIGISCPLLKSFTFNPHWDGNSCNGVTNEYALAIGKSMPNLCHLGLFGSKMTNRGLEAILDGCPHLESLDLRVCYNLDLREDLGERCSRHIKYLRYPRDPTDDYEWQPEVYEWSNIPRFISKDNFIIHEGQVYTHPYGRTVNFGL